MSQLKIPGLEEAIEQRKSHAEAVLSPHASLASAAPPIQNDQEGLALTYPQPAWERYLKRLVATAVIACGVSVPFLSPETDALAIKVCSIVAAVGAGLGITSRGNDPKVKSPQATLRRD